MIQSDTRPHTMQVCKQAGWPAPEIRAISWAWQGSEHRYRDGDWDRAVANGGPGSQTDPEEQSLLSPLSCSCRSQGPSPGSGGPWAAGQLSGHHSHSPALLTALNEQMA